MGKYDSSFYNSERYYDPTAGAALLAVIRSEKKSFDREMRDIPAADKRKTTEFAQIFADYYGRMFGPRENGKPRRLSKYPIVYKYLRIYQYCMDHASDEDFSVENATTRLNLGSDTKVRQVFNGRGQMGKLIQCYRSWKQTGRFQWTTKAKDTEVWKEGDHETD